MSSTTGLSRTRSIRKLATNDNGLTQNKPVNSRNEPRNVSPSRLPMRPPSTTTTATSRVRAPTGLTSRQVSGGSSTKTSSRSNGAPAAVKPLGRVQSIRQVPSPTATSSASISRSASTSARPRSSAGVASTTAPKERLIGHARAKSTATTLTAATRLQPLSQAPSRRSNPSPAPSTASSTSTTTTTQTASVTSSRVQTRSQTKHARVSSQSQSQPQTHSSTASSTLAARRPAFNTNQQHYSPAKKLAPKPLTSTFLAPPSPSKQPVNVAITAETSRLQTELLQLSLLHREAHSVSASWHASARSKLGARFRELAAADQELRAVERESAEARGLRDLIRWANASPEKENGGTDGDRKGREQERLPLDEKIQHLDQVLNGVWALGEPGGRYQRAVRAFEDWALRVAEIRAAQQGGDIDGLLARGGGGGFGIGNGGEEEEELGVFVSDLDASAWKRDHAGLVRILEGWRRTLAQLGHVETDEPESVKNGRKKETGGDAETKGDKPPSGLARTLCGCRSLVRDMLAELKVMELIERDALGAEEDWMEQMEERLRAEEKDSSRRRRTGDVPPWKALV
ncbi:hypothetical protein F4860DRAFT_490408 [Xylaria cubensis]|nr:hypothetical protein F4860DRAFT_490408 [Xylaria cubensis]